MATSKTALPLLARVNETTPPSTRTGARLFSEISALAAIPSDAILLYENPLDGMSYRLTFTNLRDAILSKYYGILQTVDGNGSPESAQGSISATPALLTAWNTNGLSASVTPDYTTGKVAVANAGTYHVDLSISFSGTATKNFVFEIYTDDISASPTPTATGFKLSRQLGAAGDVGSASINGIVNLSAGDSVMIYVSSTNSGTDILVHQSQLRVTQV
jgi:hypothetical protein